MTHPKPDVREIVAKGLAEADDWDWDSLPKKMDEWTDAQEDFFRRADAIFSALSAAGYSVVPNEPTQEQRSDAP